VNEDPLLAFVFQGMHKIFVLDEEPDYEPDATRSVEAIAKSRGMEPDEVLYDEMLELDGKALLMVALVGYHDGNLEAMREMIEYPDSAFGLGDGGAHCGMICDASIQTFMLTHWVRDRTRGERISLEFAVKRMTKDTAELYGLFDRGVLEIGMKGDLNVIDMDRVALKLPEMVYDLPENARRLIQRAEGYRATIVSGETVMRDGEPTDARPGRLVRGEQQRDGR